MKMKGGSQHRKERRGELGCKMSRNQESTVAFNSRSLPPCLRSSAITMILPPRLFITGETGHFSEASLSF